MCGHRALLNPAVNAAQVCSYTHIDSKSVKNNRTELQDLSFLHVHESMKLFQQMWGRSNESNSIKIFMFVPEVASEAQLVTNCRQETLWKQQAGTQTCDSRNSRVYFISIHLSTAQQKCNTSLLLFSHFITVQREFHFDVLRIYVMSALKGVWNALLCWGQGNHHFHVCWAPTTFLNRIPCWCWCCLGAGPGNMLLLLGFRKLGKLVHFRICFFPPAAFGMRFSYIL